MKYKVLIQYNHQNTLCNNKNGCDIVTCSIKLNMNGIKKRNAEFVRLYR